MSKEFLTEGIEIDGLQLRPYTIRARINSLKLGLTLFTDPEAVLSQGEIEEQTIALAWERSQPRDVVRKAIDSGTAAELIYDWSDKIGPEKYGKIVTELNRISALIRESSVDVIPRPGAEDKDAPGNS